MLSLRNILLIYSSTFLSGLPLLFLWISFTFCFQEPNTFRKLCCCHTTHLFTRFCLHGYLLIVFQWIDATCVWLLFFPSKLSWQWHGFSGNYEFERKSIMLDGMQLCFAMCSVIHKHYLINTTWCLIQVYMSALWFEELLAHFACECSERICKGCASKSHTKESHPISVVDF